MNGLVPAMIVVLLAEFGQRGQRSSGHWQEAAVWAGIVAIVGAASVAGLLMAPRMTDWAGALMIGLALALAAVGQLFRAKTASSVIAQLWAFWSGGAPLIAFAFAIRFGPLAAGVGTLTGVVVAAATAGVIQNAVPLRIARAVAAVILFAIAAVVATQALRLA